MKWLNIWWWRYLFDNNTGLNNIICRIRNHPHGVIWYNFNPYNLEPDMRCKDCHEELG